MRTLEIIDGKDKFVGLVIGEVTEGETTYKVVVTKHGGIWYKGDWVTDRWHFLSERAFAERFSKLATESLNTPRLAEIREELDKVGLLCF